jgi:hypothetical protein
MLIADRDLLMNEQQTATERKREYERLIAQHENKHQKY